jgi:hypothetical protein
MSNRDEFTQGLGNLAGLAGSTVSIVSFGECVISAITSSSRSVVNASAGR